MNEKKEHEVIEKTLETLNERFLDINGDILPLKIMIDKILKNDEDSERRYAEG